MADIREIADFSAPELDIFARLRENQLAGWECAEKGIFIAESPKVIDRALTAGYEPIAFLMERRHVENQGRELLARCGQVPVFTAEEPDAVGVTGVHLTRGRLCAMKRRELPTVEQVCAGARRVAVLERVMNPTNVGAIFRSAAALGMDAVLLTPECSDPLYRRSTRVSMGTVFQVPWTYLPEGSWTEKLHEMGFRTAAMALREDSVRLNDPQLLAEERLAVALGTEGDGLADGSIESCDYTVCIPMAHGVDSLNVAAASAVAFYQLGQVRE